MTGMGRESASQARVVLADDDVDWRELLAASLARAGHHVEQVADGRELQLLLEAAEVTGRSPDLVVSDHLMPYATGLEVLAWAARHTPEVPFVILSAFAAPFVRRPALRLGALAVIDKPVDVDVLEARIAEILGRRLHN